MSNLLLYPSAAVPPLPTLSDPPTDSISSLAFSPDPTSNVLAVGAWDGDVRLYDVNVPGVHAGRGPYGLAKARTRHDGPVLDLCWTEDGSRLISVGADGSGNIYDLATGQSAQIAQHEAPIKSVRCVQASTGSHFLVTGGWDRRLNFWDLRAPNLVGSAVLPERCFTMDCWGDSMVVGTAEKHVVMYDLKSPTQPINAMSSPLKWQTRVVACFPSRTSPGFAIGSIEGRISYNYTSLAEQSKTFSFKCHRKEPASRQGPLKPTQVYAVNAMSIHKGFGTLASAGSDGGVHFWDCVNRVKLKSIYPPPNDKDAFLGPVVATAFNSSHSIFAYAHSYDWSKGHEGNTSQMQTRVVLHAVKEDEVRPKTKN